MPEVYKALDQQSGHFVAVKQVSLGGLHSGDIGSIEVEINLLSKLKLGTRLFGWIFGCFFGSLGFSLVLWFFGWFVGSLVCSLVVTWELEHMAMGQDPNRTSSEHPIQSNH